MLAFVQSLARAGMNFYTLYMYIHVLCTYVYHKFNELMNLQVNESEHDVSWNKKMARWAKFKARKKEGR